MQKNKIELFKQSFRYKDEGLFWSKIRSKPASRSSVEKFLKQIGLNIGYDELLNYFKMNPDLAQDAQLSPVQAMQKAYEYFKALNPPIRVYNKEGDDILFLIDANNQYRRIENKLYSNALDTAYKMNPYLTKLIDEVCSLSLDNKNILASKFTKGQIIKALYERLLYDSDFYINEQPALISWNPETPAFLQLSESLISPGPTPNWDALTSRMSHPEIYMAFIWSIFEPRSNGRQVLWLHGAGKDGKSSASYAITKFLGEKFVLSLSTGDYDDNFFWHRCYGKRLAIYGDCSNNFFLKKEKIKQLTGGDQVMINPKGERAFTAQVYSKIIVNSNLFPHINVLNRSELSRLILITIKKYDGIFADSGDNDYKERLYQEMPAFLYKCRQYYPSYFKTQTDIIIPDDMMQSIKTSCRSADSYFLEKFVNTCLIFDPHATVERGELQNYLSEFFAHNGLSRQSQFAYDDLVHYLSLRQVYPEDASIGTKMSYVFRGIKLDKKNLLNN